MPIYSFTCRKCEKTFEVFAAMAQRAGQAVLCPDCGSGELTRVYAPIAVISGGRKGGRPAGGCTPGSGCCG